MKWIAKYFWCDRTLVGEYMCVSVSVSMYINVIVILAKVSF